MDIRAVLFDVNGTLVDIHTEDHADDVFRAAAQYLTYQGIDLGPDVVRDRYFSVMRSQRAASPERHPEFDVVAIWRHIVAGYASDFTRCLPAVKLAQIPLFLAELTRGVAMRRLRPYPHVGPVLELLRRRFALAVVSDAQSPWARAELQQVGLLGYFDPVVVSGDHGFRKPDPRLFRRALDALAVVPGQAIYVGNDLYRDVFGAREVGMVTVRFDSDRGENRSDDRQMDVVPDYTITDHRELVTLFAPS